MRRLLAWPLSPYSLSTSVGSRVGPLGPGNPRRFVLTKAAANISCLNSLVVQTGTLSPRNRECPIQAPTAIPEAILLTLPSSHIPSKRNGR